MLKTESPGVKLSLLTAGPAGTGDLASTIHSLHVSSSPTFGQEICPIDGQNNGLFFLFLFFSRVRESTVENVWLDKGENME